MPAAKKSSKKTSSPKIEEPKPTAEAQPDKDVEPTEESKIVAKKSSGKKTSGKKSGKCGCK
jgi:hypothetical protein